MHIPDGYLGPQTYISAYAAAVPFWMTASRKLNKTLRSKQVPLLALGAAFCFVIMMLNIPIIGGTTGHAVGVVLIAILLGPWAACIAVSIAVIVQALIFGDGGVTAIGANCLNMAVIMPFVGYWVYRLIAGSSDLKSKKRWIGAVIGGYAGINAAALTTAIILGIQPIIAHDAAGKALYAPFPLKLAITVMVGEHLILFGIVEAVVTGLVIKYIQKTDVSLFFDQPKTPAMEVESK
jgi:cobalt/nickel transport system permease protein